MPCSCDGYPPSPCYGDLIGSAEAAIKKIADLEKSLESCQSDRSKLIKELLTLKEAFKIMGNGG